jgi:hypothetical protein
MISRRLVVVFLGFGLCLGEVWACSSSSGTTGTATGGSGGTGVAVSSSHHSSSVIATGTGGSSSNIGIACASDADCGAGLSCIAATANDPIFLGGPANGYCSASCTTDTDCPGSGAMCYTGNNTTGPGNCVLSCTLGPKLMYLNDDISSDGKCNQRNDVRCQAINATTDICLPTCGEDSQCPTGRVCDPQSSVCVDMAATGLPSGSVCDPTSTTAQCAGICVSFSAADGGAGPAICSEYCELGGDPNSPSDTPNCGGVNVGLCAYSPTGNGAGDYGFCANACTTQDDCQLPNFWCTSVMGLTGTMGVANGFCFGSTACPNGASDCTSIKNATCTPTAYGPQCLTGDFPLGSATPDGGAGTGGSAPDSGTDSGTEPDSGVDSGSSVDAGSGTGGSSVDAGTGGSSVDAG